MEPNLRLFRDKFQLDGLTVCETEHWIWSVRPVQATLGASILSLRRYCERLSEITPEEGADLARVVKLIEGGLHANFAYDKINYLMLMMVDPHLHYHVLPRYAGERSFGGATWTDAGWPTQPVITGSTPEPAVLQQLRDLLARSC
jgi:diadenosine tetraphosphate (Ap4A) HIT family hydrolase